MVHTTEQLCNILDVSAPSSGIISELCKRISAGAKYYYEWRNAEWACREVLKRGDHPAVLDLKIKARQKRTETAEDFFDWLCLYREARAEEDPQRREYAQKLVELTGNAQRRIVDEAMDGDSLVVDLHAALLNTID